MRFSNSSAFAAMLAAGAICFWLNGALHADELDFASLVQRPAEFTSVQIGQ